jgi:hypothetical protein
MSAILEHIVDKLPHFRIVIDDKNCTPVFGHTALLFGRMLKQSASFVLASLRSSTCRSARFASSLVAALLNGLFEHPADN